MALWAFYYKGAAGLPFLGSNTMAPCVTESGNALEFIPIEMQLKSSGPTTVQFAL